MKRTLAVIATIAACAVPWSATARTIELTDVRRIVGISQPNISPDGRQVVFIKSVINFGKDKRDSQLILVDVATGRMRTLTYDRTGLDSPRWSPSGDRVAFIADAGTGDETQSQIFVLPMNGGDALEVTKAPNGVQEFTWKPDGTALAYVAQDEAPNKKALKNHLDAFDVGDLDYKSSAAPVPSHLWIASDDGKSTKRLTSGSWSLSTVNSQAGSPVSWSADGKTIAITRLPNAVYGDSDPATVALVDVKSKMVRNLPNQRSYLVGPTFAPTGTSIAMYWFRHGTFNSNAYLVVAPASGGAGFEPARALDHALDWFDWTPDGRALLVAAEDGPRTGLWLQPLGGAAARRLDLGDVQFSDASVSKSGAIAVIGTTPAHPAELYYLASPSARLRRLTNLNAPTAALALGNTSEVTWAGPGGFAEDGIVTTPPGFDSKKKYPLVLVVHGGPQGASQLSFGTLTQLLAARGFVVFQPNYRGSTNLGDAYQHAIYRDTGDGPGKDAMAGVKALESLGFVDTTRMCVSGWSYGGYMTTWLESHYNVWKCAMAGAALTDWVADYTISWYQEGDADFFGSGSSPWTNAGWNIWRDQSPIAFVQNVKAPTLIMGDVGDANVPIYNSYAWYHALKDEGVYVEFVAFPRDSHFPGDPVGQEDVTRRWVDWMVRYLK
jgi:dipeptidyl aminopeptidase/acylaminoacyl peptidase